MVRKIPGTMFSSFSFIQGYPDAYTTEDAMRTLHTHDRQTNDMQPNPPCLLLAPYLLISSPPVQCHCGTMLSVCLAWCVILIPPSHP